MNLKNKAHLTSLNHSLNKKKFPLFESHILPKENFTIEENGTGQ